jgi:drug/metabolite transporter (DMT)-like permease
MDNKRQLIAHLSMLLACIFWGLMAPLGKDAMTHGITGIDMVTFRVIGGALLFWFSSLFVKHEKISRHDLLMLFFAGIFGLVCNQCCYTIGLSITSPVNASIVVTSMPIFTMILAAIILHEPITSKKVLGVFLGCIGAVALILTSASATSDKVGDIRGDLLCMLAQLSFALYLTLFNHLVKRYSVFTINKWMFTSAVFIIVPFSFHHVVSISWSVVPVKTWIETGYVVLFGTYISYILTMVGQKTLRPTVVSAYNYVQPMVSVTVSILLGIGVFKLGQAFSVIFVFAGVWLVNKSKSRDDLANSK